MNNLEWIPRKAMLSWLALICFAVAACNGGSGSAGGPGPLNLSLSSSMALAPQDGTQMKITANVTGNSGPVTLTVSGVPTGTTSNVVQPSGSAAGTITLYSSASTPAGTYTLKVTATDGPSAASQNLTLVVAVAAMVASTVDQALGVSGKLQQLMSASFQPAEWDYLFFQNHPVSEPAQLNTLGPQHIRLQALSQAVPMTANTGAVNDWDFAKLDAVVQPVLAVTDHSPEFQIAVAPGFLNDPISGHFVMNTANLNIFAAYCANLVRYYNTGGFTWGGQLFKSASPNRITW